MMPFVLSKCALLLLCVFLTQEFTQAAYSAYNPSVNGHRTSDSLLSKLNPGTQTAPKQVLMNELTQGRVNLAQVPEQPLITTTTQQAIITPETIVQSQVNTIDRPSIQFQTTPVNLVIDRPMPARPIESNRPMIPLQNRLPELNINRFSSVQTATPVINFNSVQAVDRPQIISVPSTTQQTLIQSFPSVEQRPQQIVVNTNPSGIEQIPQANNNPFGFGQSPQTAATNNPSGFVNSLTQAISSFQQNIQALASNNNGAQAPTVNCNGSDRPCPDVIISGTFEGGVFGR